MTDRASGLRHTAGGDAPRPGLDTATIAADPSPTSEAECLERRRHGRPKNVSPHMIPLLRRAAIVEIVEDHVSQYSYRPRGDDLAPAKGILLGILIAVPFWLFLAAMVWLLV